MLLIAACSASSPRVPAVHGTATDDVAGGGVDNVYCPRLSGDSWPWKRELFPACPTSVMATDLPVCAGECPRPCRVEGRGMGMHDFGGWEATFAYDGAGQMILAQYSPGDPTPWVWKDGLLDHGATYAGPVHAERDPAGRLIAIVGAGPRQAVTRAGDRVVAVGPVEIGYDLRGRITSVVDRDRDDRTDVEYDDDGRVTATRDRRYLVTWTYRDGRIAEVDSNTLIDPDAQRRRTTQLVYDDQGRLAAINSGGYTEDHSSMTELAYDCP